MHLSVNALASLYTGWATSRGAAWSRRPAAASTDAVALDASFAGPRPFLFDNY